MRRELGGAGVDPLVDPADAERLAPLPRPRPRCSSSERGDPGVGEARRLGARAAAPAAPRPGPSRRARLRARRSRAISRRNQGSMCGRPVHLLDRPALAQRGEDREQALPVGDREAPAQAHRVGHPLARAPRGCRRARATASPFMQRLVEGAADRHHLAHRLHRGAERRRRVRGTSRTPSAGS